jgi:hypothetical protein
MLRATLPGGDIRLSTDTAAFVFRRIRPGVLCTAGRGHDTGGFGTTPLDIVELESALFARPVQWFFDATAVDNVSQAVARDWTRWLRTSKETLGQLHVLVSSSQMHLHIGVARHFSGAPERVVLYDDREKWTEALRRTVQDDTLALDLSALFDAPEISVSLEHNTEEGTVIRTARASWSFLRMPGNVVFSKFTGDDRGDLCDYAFAELQRAIGSSPRVRWFIDLQEARTVSPASSRAWTEWLKAHSTKFERVCALATSPLFPLVLTVASYATHDDKLIRVFRDAEGFQNELQLRVASA